MEAFLNLSWGGIMVEKGKMVKISYDGYVDGKLFDTTNEELAK